MSDHDHIVTYTEDRELRHDVTSNPHFESMGTDKLSGGYPGRVYAIAGGKVVASVDPTSSSSPVQDAIDAIGVGNRGTIKLPPGTIQDTGGWTGLGYKSVLGDWGSTVVEITDETVPVIDVNVKDDLEVSYIDGIWFENLTTPRTAPAIDWSASTKMAHQGRTFWNNFSGDDLFSWTSGGYPWSSHWEFIRARLYDRFIHWGDADNVGMSIANCYLGSDDQTTPEIERTVTNASGYLNVESWNKGQVSCPVFTGIGGTVSSGVRFGPGNYEPSSGTGADHVFYFGFKLRSELHHFHTHNATINNDTIHLDNNQGRKWIFANHPVRISSDNKGPLIYGGASTDINNVTGAALTYGVACLGDLTLVT